MKRRKIPGWMLVTVMALPGMAAADGGPEAWDREGRVHERHGRRGGPHLEERREERLDRMVRFLDLNDQQVEEWREIRAGHESEMRGQLEGVGDLLRQVDETIEAGNADPAEVGRMVIEVHERRAAAAASREQMHEQLAAVLTPEQLERFEAMRELHGESHRGPFSRRGGARHGRHGRWGGPSGAGDGSDPSRD